MWEVGEKYKHKSFSETIYEVTYVNEDGALVKYDYGKGCMYSFINNNKFHLYKKWKEPIVHTRYVHFYRNRKFNKVETWTTKEKEKPESISEIINYKYIGYKEVSITEEVE